VAEPGVLHAYRALLGSRARAQASYRASLALDLIGSAAAGVVEFGELYVIFHNVDLFGGLELPAAMLVFALANLGFSLADLFAGNLDQVPTLIRMGTLDVMLLRPLPLLGQLITGEVTLRRLGRASFAVLILVVGLLALDVDWTPGRVLLLAVTPIAGAVVFAALFLAAGAVQFWLVDGGEFTHAFTYGSSYASSFSAAVMPLPLRVFFTFVIPAAFVGYLPTVALLGLPGPPGLPSWLGWCLPGVAVVAWYVSLGLWRVGVRHYQGGGG